jgi:hypothetical protein
MNKMVILCILGFSVPGFADDCMKQKEDVKHFYAEKIKMKQASIYATAMLNKYEKAVDYYCDGGQGESPSRCLDFIPLRNKWEDYVRSYDTLVPRAKGEYFLSKIRLLICRVTPSFLYKYIE